MTVWTAPVGTPLDHPTAWLELAEIAELGWAWSTVQRGMCDHPETRASAFGVDLCSFCGAQTTKGN